MSPFPVYFQLGRSGFLWTSYVSILIVNFNSCGRILTLFLIFLMFWLIFLRIQDPEKHVHFLRKAGKEYLRGKTTGVWVAAAPLTWDVCCLILQSPQQLFFFCPNMRPSVRYHLSGLPGPWRYFCSASGFKRMMARGMQGCWQEEHLFWVRWV